MRNPEAEKGKKNRDRLLFAPFKRLLKMGKKKGGQKEGRKKGCDEGLPILLLSGFFVYLGSLA